MNSANSHREPLKPLSPAAMWVRGLWGLAAVAVVVVGIGVGSLWSRPATITIGVEGKHVVEIPGPLLSAAPFTPGDAISLRIAATEKTTAGYRYELRYIAYGPGEHDLGKSLFVADNQRPEKLPPLKIAVSSILPKDHEGELFETKLSSIDLHSRYTFWMGLSWLAWGGLIVPLFLWGRQWRKVVQPPPHVPNVSERLAELLLLARENILPPQQQAELEQLLMGYWARRLNISTERFSRALGEMKQHPQAGKQIALVERWLHSRGQSRDANLVEQLWKDLAPDLPIAAAASAAAARAGGTR